MADNQQTPGPPAEIGNNSAPEARSDERTPLLGRDGEQSSPAEATAGGAFSENVRRWRRQRWASTVLAVLLVVLIVTLTLVFGGQPFFFFNLDRILRLLARQGVLGRPSLTRWHIVFGKNKTHASNALCLTPACAHVASELLYSLSPDYKNVDPCTDFDKCMLYK